MKTKSTKSPGAGTNKPDRDHIKHAVYYAVASISGRSMADLEEAMVLDGQMPTGVGMDGIAIDAVAGMLNTWISHRGGEGQFEHGELKADTTLGETIDAVDGKF
jgi:hypothetical protein